MIIDSGTLDKNINLSQLMHQDAIWPILATFGKEMKPLIFDTSKTLTNYAEAAEIANAIFKHLRVDRARIALNSIMHESEIFAKPNARDAYLHILGVLNPAANYDEITPLIPANILESLKERDGDNKCHISAVLLNEPYDSLRIDHVKHLFQAVSKSEFYKAGMMYKGKIVSDRMDDFTTCMYVFNNPDWLDRTKFANISLLKESETAAVQTWLRENYDFIYRLLMTYYNPTEYMELSKTRGFGFTSFVSLLHLIKDRIDLSYWDFSADLWINLNLIGYNPYKEICNMDKKLNTVYGKKLLSKLNASMVVNYFVNIVNNKLTRFVGATTNAFKHDSIGYVYFTEPTEVLRTMIGDYLQVDVLKDRLISAGHKAAAEAFDFHSCVRRTSIIREYGFDVTSLDMYDRLAAMAFGYLPAYLSPKSLDFGELNHRAVLDICKPNVFDFLQYLYIHRGWLGKKHQYPIGRGIDIDIHAHTAVLEIYNSWDEHAGKWSFQASPNDTFKIGFENSSRSTVERMNGGDFDNLPVYLLPALNDRFFHIRNPYDLISEGNIMNHCCGGSHYVDECVDGERVFFHYQPDDSVHYAEGVTFDLDVDSDDGSTNYYSLSSANMHSNKNVPAECMEDIKQFIKRLNELEKQTRVSQLAKAC